MLIGLYVDVFYVDMFYVDMFYVDRLIGLYVDMFICFRLIGWSYQRSGYLPYSMVILMFDRVTLLPASQSAWE